MPVSLEVAAGLDEAFSKSKQILSDFLNALDTAWVGWKSGDPIPSVSYEQFDYNKHFAEVVINSFYNSISNGFLTIPPGVIAGTYLLGSYVSAMPAVCSWKEGTEVQTHIDAVKSYLESMFLLASGGAFDGGVALLGLASCIANEVHAMVSMGKLSADAVVGVYTIPGSPPVVSSISIDVSGSLTGVNVSLVNSIFQALNSTGSSPDQQHMQIGQAMEEALVSYCLGLSGVVVGEGLGSSCAGSFIGFVVS